MFVESCLHSLLQHWADVKPSAPYLYYRDEIITFSEVNDRAKALAAALWRSGIRPGDRVAVMMCNRPELVYAYFACFRLGVIAVPINTRYTQREAGYVLVNSGAAALIVSSQYFPLVQPLCRKGELHDHTIIVDGAKDGIDHWVDYEAFIADVETPAWPEVELDAPAIMLHTSGSTARPKGVIHSHRTLFHAVRFNVELYDTSNLPTTAVYLSALYIGGICLHLIRNAYAGCACALIEKREIGELLNTIRKWKCSDLVLMPTDLVLLLEHPEAKTLDWSCVKVIMTGGDKATPELHEKIEALTGLSPLQGYGMTECVPIAANSAQRPNVPGSMGPVVPGVEIELRLPDGGLAPDGEIGDLWVKSPAIFVEYWNNPQVTAQTKCNGWLNTGDRARRDADGYYWFEGRSKLIIVHHGSNIAPQEVEEVLDHHPAVMSSCVVGLPDAIYGEKVCGIVELRPGQSVTEAELIDYARHHIAAYKAPESIILLERMPTNSSGKLDRAKMKQLALDSVAGA
ncbi:class I adenylate-forming enzyme family protein [Cerasicoccus frondis]|uniref:class I adenylate-forming enzyme family protein n=1 Tax=Cerasicoccus frondis TaxID=490090 RepID=UPI002852B6CD|nr:class I adenylate-forming enzyme family protein [Cerasicoccus frondis]